MQGASEQAEDAVKVITRCRVCVQVGTWSAGLAWCADYYHSTAGWHILNHVVQRLCEWKLHGTTTTWCTVVVNMDKHVQEQYIQHQQ